MTQQQTQQCLWLAVASFILFPLLGIFSLYHAVRTKKLENVNSSQHAHELHLAYKWAKCDIVAFAVEAVISFIALSVLYQAR